MATATYLIEGMTCSHCVDAVRSEVGALPGVTDVDVDLATGEVAVRSDHPIGDEAIRGAVEEAGYEVAS